jgi:hypothetical protein
MKKGKHIKTIITTALTELPKTQSLSQVVINVKPSNQDDITDLPGYEKEEYDTEEIRSKSVCWNRRYLQLLVVFVLIHVWLDIL